MEGPQGPTRVLAMTRYPMLGDYPPPNCCDCLWFEASEMPDINGKFRCAKTRKTMDIYSRCSKFKDPKDTESTEG